MAASQQARASASSSTAAAAATTTTRSSSPFVYSVPNTPPQPPIRHSSSAHTLRYGAADSYPDPPSTPPNKHRRPLGLSRRRGASGGSSKEIGQGRSSRDQRGTRGQHEAVITARGDPRHSHGLSWSSNTRDSLVDNLLMSLDGLSQLANHNIDDLVRERERQAQWERHDVLNAMAQPPSRPRGHTHSSSMSSERPTPDSPASAFSTPGQHSRRSVSSSNFANVNADGSIRPRKVSAVETERDATIRNRAHGNGNVDHVRGYSDASSMDNGYATALETPKLALGGVRSISMDHIHRSASQHQSATGASVLSRGRPVPSVYSRYESNLDAAPEPMVPAGPRKMQNPNATGPVYVNQTPKVSALRKITTQSDLRAVSSATVPPEVRERASDFVRASSMRDTANMAQTAERAVPVPPLPAPRKDAPSPQRERPGFFKRVFGGGGGGGSSSSMKSSNDRQDASVQHQPQNNTQDTSAPAAIKSESRQASADHTGGQPALNKKPSSFFRRRKKSTSETEHPQPPPPPPPLTAADHVRATAQARTSVSSLRKVMDPYLSEKAGNIPAGARARKDNSRPPTGNSTISDDLDIFHSGYTPPADAALNLSKVNLGEQENDSPRLKVKVRKQRNNEPRPISTPQSRPSDSSAAPYDSVFRDHSAIRTIKTNADTSSIEPPKVSPLSDLAPPPNMQRRPSSLLPAEVSGEESGQEMRAFAAGNNVDLNLESDNWLAMRGKNTFAATEARPSTTNLESRASESKLAITPAPIRTASQASETPATSQNDASEAVVDPNLECRERARRIFDGDEQDIHKMDAASWLGETKSLNTRTLHEYMQLFDFSQMNILTALRTLCGKLVLRGETQQFDRIITALSSRWCECNPYNGFKAQDVVHTICYSLILLNTDLHLADIGEKMSRSAYVKNTLPTVRRVVADAAPNAFDETARMTPRDQARPSIPWMEGSVPNSPSFPPDTPQERTSFDSGRPTMSKRNSMRPGTFRTDSDGPSADIIGSNSLVTAPMAGAMRAWEAEIEVILKSFFTSIRNEPLPLLSLSMSNQTSSDRLLSVNTSGLKRTGSVVSRAPSEIGTARSRGLRSLTLGWQARNNRSRQKVFMTNTMSSSRTSFDDSNSVWSPTQSSTWSKNSMGKTLTSSSMNSLAASYIGGDREFKHSIGFANALSHAIIREEGGGIIGADSESFIIKGDLLEDESLTLEGAPWAKEGMLKHKHHLEGPERKAKERSWNGCFAVISRGKLTLFNFNTEVKTRSLGRPRTKQGSQAPSIAGTRVGGGDWMENAEQLAVFVLHHTISTTLPSPGYSKARPHVWALSLPSGAVHLFQVGTPEIAQEWMTTANYWSARLSKEPLSGGVSNIEYGWSDAVVNTALLEKSASFSSPPSSMMNKTYNHGHSASNSTMPTRQSINSSIRGSLDIGSAGSKQRLPGDKVHITDWTPPSQSVMASQLPEHEQIRSLTTYVMNVELDLEKHHELKHAIELAFSPRHANYNKAMSNWQRKSEYLLREIVKFRTYIDSLTAAQKMKEEVYTRRAERSGKSPTSAVFAGTAGNAALSPNASSRDLTRTTSNITASTVSLHIGEFPTSS